MMMMITMMMMMMMIIIITTVIIIIIIIIIVKMFVFLTCLQRLYQISVKGLRVLPILTFTRLYGFYLNRNGARSDDGLYGRQKQATILNYRWCNSMTVYLTL